MAGPKIEPAALTAACESATAKNVDNNGSSSEPTRHQQGSRMTTTARLLRTASISAPPGVSVRMPAMAPIDMTMPISASFQFRTVSR